MTKKEVLGMYFKCADLDERDALIERLEGMGVTNYYPNLPISDCELYLGIDMRDGTFTTDKIDGFWMYELMFNSTLTHASSFLAQFEPAINEHGDPDHATPEHLKL